MEEHDNTAALTTYVTTKTKTTKKQGKERARKDTFWSYSPEENGAFFQSILDEEDKTYRIYEETTKKDYKGKDRTCWRAYSLTTGNPCDSIRSTKPYRLALVWAATKKKPSYLRERKLKRLVGDLPKISGKRGDHSRHRCGMDWCCNPGHIVVGSRTKNEVDKHFHYFLNHADASVRDRFRAEFPDMMKAQGVW